MNIKKIESVEKYPAHKFHNCIDSYKDPIGEWAACPNCGLKPKVWEFDNGRFTACGCWKSLYDQFSVRAESIMSVHARTGGKQMDQYDHDGLRKNWNHWCLNGYMFFSAEYGRW